MHRFMIVAAVWAAFSLSMVGQTSPAKPQGAAKSSYTPPKTPWGEPDLQGNWPAQFNIPRTRPENAKDTVLSDEEVAQRQAQTAKQFQSRVQNPRGEANVTIGPPSKFAQIAKPHKQTSRVVDPPDGRMPALTPQARAILQAERGGLGPGQHFADTGEYWADIDYYIHCI